MVAHTSANFSMGVSKLQYKCAAGDLVPHLITSEDIVKNSQHMKEKRESMRKANFKIPYVSDMRTERSTYDVNISELGNKNKGTF